MLTNQQDENTWMLISKVVSGNASETEQHELSCLCENNGNVEQTVTELRAFWSLTAVVDPSESDAAFQKLQMKLRNIPD
jgi:hypothetical protein